MIRQARESLADSAGSGAPIRRSAACGTRARTIWLLFIMFPLSERGRSRRGGSRAEMLTVAGAAAFVAVYLVLVLTWRRDARPAGPRGAARDADRDLDRAHRSAAEPGVGVPVHLLRRRARAPRRETRMGFWLVVVLCAALAGGMPALAGGVGRCRASASPPATAGIGLLMLLMRDLRVRNEELRGARAELARLAVARERERFARDLHDLLGHTLSVIALKAELAGRLLPDRPTRRGA